MRFTARCIFPRQNSLLDPSGALKIEIHLAITDLVDFTVLVTEYFLVSSGSGPAERSNIDCR